MQLIRAFFRQHPRQCLLVWLCIVVASIADGVGVSTLLPILTMATGARTTMVDEQTSDYLSDVLQWLSIEPTLPTMLAIVVAGLIIKALLMLLAYRQVGYTVAEIATDYRLDFLRALSATRWEYFISQRTGHLSNTISTEAANSAEAFKSLSKLAAMISQATVFLVVALLINWKIAVLAFVVGAMIFALLKVMVSVSRNAGSRQKNSVRQLMALLTDALVSMKPLKSMARERQIDRLLERETKGLKEALRTRVLAREALKTIQELLVGLVMVAGVIAALVIWKMPLSEIMVLSIVLSRVLSQLSKVQQEYQNLASREAFYWAMNDQIRDAQAAAEQPFGRQKPSLQTGIRLANVSFGYADNQVLHNLDLTIPAGGFTTLVGFSGAGKTTVIDLVIGLLRTQQGQVLIDGTPIDDLDIRAWRAMIGYVPQDTTLLHDSVYNNIVVGDHDLSEQAAITALKKAGAWDFVSQMAAGIHTDVGEHGGRLSGGQRQRIVIARALVHQPRLVILDEATSALDPETESSVSATLAELGGEYTVLAISHRAALTRRSSRIYRLEQGQAREVSVAEIEDMEA